MSSTNEALADIMAEMREIPSELPNPDDFCPWWADGGNCTRCPLGWGGKNCSFPKLANRIEAAVRHQFLKIRDLCQAEIDSALSDHLSAIFMLKVVRDVAQDQLSKLSSTEKEGKEEHNG